MKKIVSIISIFAIMMSLCVTSFANDLAEDEEIRGDFIYEKAKTTTDFTSATMPS